MRSPKSLVVILASGVIATSLVAACSGSDSSSFESFEADASSTAHLPNEPSKGQDSGGSVSDRADTGTGTPEQRDAASDSSTDAATDAGLDATVYADASTDAAVDAGPSTTDPEGSACATKDAIQQQSCGLCGKQYRLCAPSSSDEGAPTVWQSWGYCQNEVKNGCEPGTSTTETCGLCGTRAKVCQIDCQWAVGSCKNEPAGACSPGTVDFQQGLSCAEGGRSRTCTDACTYSAFSDCFVPGKPSITLSPNAGGKVTGEFTLTATSTIGRLGGTCPSGTINSTVTPYQYIIVVNPTASTIKAQVWTGQSAKPGSAYFDTVIASYAGDVEPSSDADRKACVKGVVDTCSTGPDATACVSSWAGLVGTNAFTVPPNGKALVYVGAWSTTGTGDYLLSAYTEALQ